MANRPKDLNGSEGENHEIGRKLYNKDKEQNQNNSQRYGNRGEDTSKWGEGNYFHTGPNLRGAQDRDNDRNNDDYRRGGSSNSSYNQGQNAHLNDHYGSRSGSAYRNERSIIDHGDRGNNQYQHDERHNMRRPHSPGGSLQGNNSDVNRQQNDPWREGPGSGSRYKDDDYRYGSGSHNWYTEDRYTPNDNSNRRNNERHDDRGFMDRVKDTWNDIWHSDDEDYQQRGNRYQTNADQLDSRRRYGSEQYRNRNFDSGYEGGPRWADESDSGQDDNHNDRDNSNRRRR